MKITFQRIGVESASIVQEIYEASPKYFHLVDRSEVMPGFAERDILDCVPQYKQTPSYEKIFCIIYADGKAVGIIDLHNNHAKEGTAYLGLFLLDERVQKKGLGRECFFAAEEFIRKELKATKIRLGVAEQNNVEVFWKKMGFERTGTSYLWQGENFQNNCFEMEKDI